MKVSMSDVIYVLELHMETPEAAAIVLDLLDYVIEEKQKEEDE